MKFKAGDKIVFNDKENLFWCNAEYTVSRAWINKGIECIEIEERSYKQYYPSETEWDGMLVVLL